MLDGTPGSAPLLLVVAVALIDDAGRVLVQQRPPGREMAGLWEFPGGKVDVREAPEAALVRELREELGIEVAAAALDPEAFTSAMLDDGRRLLLLLYRCRVWNGEPRALHATALRWEMPAGLRALAMPPADLPLIATLEARAGIEPACKDLQSSA